MQTAIGTQYDLMPNFAISAGQLDVIYNRCRNRVYGTNFDPKDVKIKRYTNITSVLSGGCPASISCTICNRCICTVITGSLENFYTKCCLLHCSRG